MIDDDDTTPHPHLGLPLPEIAIVPEDPPAPVLAAVRAYVTGRRAAFIGRDRSYDPNPYRVQDAVRHQHGVDAPIEQIAGALQRL